WRPIQGPESLNASPARSGHRANLSELGRRSWLDLEKRHLRNLNRLIIRLIEEFEARQAPLVIGIEHQGGDTAEIHVSWRLRALRLDLERNLAFALFLAFGQSHIDLFEIPDLNAFQSARIAVQYRIGKAA